MMIGAARRGVRGAGPPGITMGERLHRRFRITGRADVGGLNECSLLSILGAMHDWPDRLPPINPGKG